MTPDGGALRAVLTSGAAFAAGFIGGGAAWWTIALTGGAAAGSSSGGWLDSSALVAWLIGFQAAVNALAFAALTAFSRRWRRQAPRHRAVVSALLGAVAITLSWTGLTMVVLGPARAALGVTVALWLWYALPGLIAGAVALALAGGHGARA